MFAVCIMAAVFQLFFPCLAFVLSRQNGVSGEVPDDVVYTDLHKTVRLGDSVVLKCQFRGTPLAVYWKKGDDPRTAPNLVSWIPTDNVTGLCEGERPCQIMEMNEDFSLIIKEVSIEEQGGYICRVSSYKGILIHNFTDISVFSTPTKPYPFINECLGPPDKNQSCIISTDDPINISCSASGYYPDLDLFFLHGSQDVTTIDSKELTNEDGTKHKSIIARASPSQEPYDCVASDIPGVAGRSLASVLVNPPPVQVTTVTTETAPNVIIKVVPVTVIVVLIVVIIFIIWWNKKREGYGPLRRYQLQDKGKISDYELKKLAEILEIGSLSQIVSELMGESSIESKGTSRDDLHQRLCEWKKESSGDARLLYSAMEKCHLEKDLHKTEAFLASEKDMVSYQDLEHICWHVQKCGETVKPILRSLRFPFRNTNKDAKNSQFLIALSRCDEIREDLQMMKSWQVQSVEEACLVEDEDCDHGDETITYRTKSDKASIIGGHTKQLPSNQMIKLCRALEKAGEKTGNSDGGVYLQLSKTFYTIQDEYKRELTDEDLKKFALGITRRHCQRLGKSLRLRERDIDVRNKEDLTVMFRTDIMLKAWMLDQRCSNYEIRRRLRRAAEQCNRQDIADLFISKDQSEVMSFDATLQASLTFTNEKQSPKANAPESSKNENHENGDLMDTEGTQLADSGAGSEVSYVTAISREELKRIGRYAGTDTLFAFLMKYGIGEVLEQQSPEEKELPFETKIINTLKRKLDSVHDEVYRQTDTEKLINKENTPRNVLRQFLDKHDKTTPYACLLHRGKEDMYIFNVELIELAFRLVMADVYPFAKALGINDQLLTHYKPNFGPNNLSQGTVRIIRTDDRIKMVKMLKEAGYLEEAKAIYFGFEIGLGDVVEVENSVDMAKLAQQLCVPDDIQGTSQDNQTNGVERQRSVLLRWKGTVRSSTFNQRLALADALFNMGEEQLALDVISGKYRNRMINNPQSELLASTIPEEQQSELSKVLDQKKKEGQNCQDVITAWASDKTFFEIGPVQKKKKKMLSNQLLDAGFYEFAHEIMAGAWRGKDERFVQKEAEDKGDVTSKEPPHEDSIANEQGGKETNNTNNVDVEAAAEDSASTTKEGEKSDGDGASEPPITDNADDGHYSNGQMPEESEKSVEDGASENPVTDLSGGQAEASLLARVAAFLK